MASELWLNVKLSWSVRHCLYDGCKIISETIFLWLVFPSQPRQMTLRHCCAIIPGGTFHSADRLQMCPWRCTTHVLSRLLQNNLLPSLFFSYLNTGASWHLQALDSPRPQPNISPRCSVYNYKLHCLNLTTCISTSNLHKPTPQVAAEDIADPLHLHPMNADLQIPLLGSPEIFFLLKEKMKSIKNMIFK